MDQILKISKVAKATKTEAELNKDCLALACYPKHTAKVCRCVHSVAIHRDPTQILTVSGGADGDVGLYMPEGEEPILRFEPHVDIISCCSFHNSNILTCSYDG